MRSRHSMRRRMQEKIYRTGDAGVSLSDIRSGLSLIGNSTGQRLQKTLYQTADAGHSL